MEFMNGHRNGRRESPRSSPINAFRTRLIAVVILPIINLHKRSRPSDYSNKIKTPARIEGYAGGCCIQRLYRVKM